jgi:hypothetical protein
VSGTANIGNLNVTGNVTGNLLPNANITYDLGSSTQRWKDIWLSNSTIYIGTQTISATANGVVLSGDTTVPNITAGASGNVSITGNMIPTANGQSLGTSQAPWSSAYFDGTITANTFTGNGSQLTGIQAATVTANAQPNITSVGTLTSLSTAGDLLVGGNLTVNGTVTTVNSTTVDIEDKNLTLAFSATTAAQANGGGITINGASATILYTSANDSWNFNKPMVGNLTGTASSANLATFATTANAVAGANVTGTVANATFATTSGSSTTAATVTTAAQPNITSLGSLTGLTVNGNITANGFVSLKAFTEVVADQSSSSTFAPDLANGTIQRFTATSNFTFNGFTNPVTGQSAICIITQDGTGSRTMTSTMKFAGNSKTLSTAAGAVDIIAVFYDGATYYASLTKGYL